MERPKSIRILREPQVYDLTKLSKTTRWRLEKEGLFPTKVRLSKNAVGWREDHIEQWLESKSKVTPEKGI